jgi:Zinc finger, C2H2 type
MKRHENKREFSCPDCDYKSFTKNDLDRHYACTHSSAPDHICEYCGRTFFARRLLNTHILVVHSKTEAIFSCDHVSYTFTAIYVFNYNLFLYSVHT